VAEKHKVLILGGGFGGLAAARALKSAPVDVTLVDRRNFHLFQPLLYQVATGALSPGEVAAPLRSVLNRQKNTRVLLADATDVDSARRRVSFGDGTSLPYDSLVVATGSQSFYFGNENWREYAPTPKSLEEAILIRQKIFLAFENAERISDVAQRAAWLTFIIVGGGPTGVELAGALGEIAHETLRHDFRNIRPQDARIILIEGADRLLPPYPPSLSAKATHSLEKMHVEVRTGVNVTNIDAQGVTIHAAAGDQHLPAKTILWAGGVIAPKFARKLAARVGVQTDNRGRMKVTPELFIPGHPEIFVVGDLTTLAGPDGAPLPGLAPVAMQEGAYVARTIARRLKGSPTPPFRYFDKGSLAVIGRGSAVADIFGLHLWGLPGWLIWVFVHLMYIVEFQSRIVVFIQWAFQYFTFSRGSRLITGPSSPEAAAIEGMDTPPDQAPLPPNP